MTAPRVSVLVPCFNLGRYLPETMDSVSRQTFTDYEILLVDDGSDDPETVELLATASWPNTTVFRTPNRGLARARNFMLERSRGEYVCALDADDLLDPRYLERTVAVLDSRPDLSFVSTHLRMFGTEDRVWPGTDRCDLEALLCDDTVTTAALARRSAMVDVGGYDEEMPEQGDEDWDLWIRLVKAGHRGVILPDVLFRYRRRPGSMSDRCTNGQPHLDLIEYLVRKHEDAYRRQLQPVLLWKEERISELRRANMAIERDLDGFLRPAVDRRRKELSALRARFEVASVSTPAADLPDLSALTAELRSLRAEYSRSQQEVRALRSSWSWKLMAPLRSVYEAVRRMRAKGLE